MKARIGIAMGLYWSGIMQAIDVIAMITALGTIGGLPALLSALIKYTRLAMSWVPGLQSHPAATSASHALCNKA
jgi:hypothetical protein